MKKAALIVMALVVAAAAGFFIFQKLARDPDPIYKTVKLQRGSIVATVSATGSLAAVVTVQVGTQVSGTIQKLFADYNSPVKQGQPIAQIDPSILKAQVEQAEGNYLAALANLEKAKLTAADAKRTLERNRELVKNDFVAKSDFDTAQTAYDAAVAALRATEGAAAQTRGALNQARTNLAYSTIRSPVDGIVVSRNVDVGQTVAASFQTPTLFTIAQDLTKMEVDTSVDEADVGKVREGQTATFTVDAFPEQVFQGKVVQVRNAAVVTSNVVTYVVVINVDNQDLRLKPGMTANVTVEVGRKENVLMLPNAALRFKPKPPEGQGPRPGPEKEMKRPEGGRTVYVLGPDNSPRPVAVKTGMSSDSFVEALPGELKEGEQIVVEQVTAKKKTEPAGRPRGPRF